MKEEDKTSAHNALIDLQRLLNFPEETSAWREKVVDAYTMLAQATGIVARDSDPFGPLDFLAKILYEAECASRDKIPLRWFKLSSEDQEKYRQQAIQTVASWANEELQMKRLQPDFGGRLVPRRS